MSQPDLMPTTFLSRRKKKIDTSDIIALAGKATAMLDDVRNSMPSPHPRKEAPVFTSQ